jgi:exosortase
MPRLGTERLVTADAPVATMERGTSGRDWTRYSPFAALLGLLLLYGPTLMWLFDRWTLSVWHHAHGLLIPPVVAYFVHQELRRFRGVPVNGSAWGFAIVVPALFLHALDAGMHTQLLSAVSLVLLMPGLSLLFLGVPRTAAIVFPLAFLAFALPIPLALTEQFHWQLRLVATALTTFAVPKLGVPLYTEGTTLHFAGGALEVADACSGFSTLYASLAVACLTAYTAPGTGRRLLILLAAAPIAILANALRVILLVLLVRWYGVDILDTIIHPLSGVMTFALSLPIIFWMGTVGAAAAPPPVTPDRTARARVDVPAGS